MRIAIALALVACHRDAQPVDPVQRGLDLVHAGACNDCHTPMAFDDKLGTPMPWMSLNELADDDLLAIWSYLRTIPAIENRVPDPKVPPAVFDEVTKGYAALLSASKH